MRVFFSSGSVFVLVLLLAALSGCVSKEPEPEVDPVPFYDMSVWKYAKVTGPDKVVETIRGNRLTKSFLYNYYVSKYTVSDIAPLKRAVAEICPHYRPSQVMDAVYETLSYRHVIFHDTGHHRIDRNVKVISLYESLIRSFASKHGINPAVPLAVMTWENSGDTKKMSYAACGGLGQMSLGAVRRAHSYSSQKARKLKMEALSISDPEKKKEMLAKAELFNIQARHGEIAKKSGVSDERMIPECNAEDSVVYLRCIMDSFDGRSDLAISAYHNGVMNNDDLVKVLMRQCGVYDETNVPAFIAERDVTYLTLWNNSKIRNMMNGFLTMDGVVTNDSNSSEALGDESDIYPWKIFGAYSALIDTDEGLATKIRKCSGTVESVETDGLESFDNMDSVRKAVKEGKLVLQNHRTRNGNVVVYLRPEMAGFLKKVHRELVDVTKEKKIFIPAYGFISEGYLSGDAPDPLHLKGVAFDVNMNGFKHAGKLRLILKREWLNDRIYMRRSGDVVHVCLNPRYGLEFMSSK